MAKKNEVEECLRDHLLLVQAPDFACGETEAKREEITNLCKAYKLERQDNLVCKSVGLESVLDLNPSSSTC